MLGANALALIAPGEGEAGAGELVGGAAVRRRLERRRLARARVHLVQQPRAGYGAGGGIGSKQVAEVTLPREELDEVWSAEHLGRFARTYWRFLTRVSPACYACSTPRPAGRSCC